MKKTDKKTSARILTASALSISMALCMGLSSASMAGGNDIPDPVVHGEEAHKNHCYKCHTDKVYTREDRFVKSIDALSKQVQRCKEGSNVPWFEEDADAVVQFLNKKYYRF